ILESKGIVIAKAQSGFFVTDDALYLNPNFRSSTKQVIPVNFLNENSSDLNTNITCYPDKNPFGTAIISSDLIPYRDIAKLVKKVMNEKKILTRTLSYTEPKGIRELRSSISRRYGMRGLSVHLDALIISNGCLDAVSLCLRAVTKPGDSIAVESPTYYGMLQLLKSLDLNIVEILTDNKQGLCLDDLEEKFKTRNIKACIFTANFQNPLGFFMSEKSKMKLVALGDKYQVPLIEDDIFGECHYGNKPTRPAKYYDNTGNVMLCSSFSKSVAPGFRLGWIVGGSFAEKITDLKKSTNLATSSIYLSICYASLFR
ncbi:MAG: PLP-dependent aminotransferase family protein, partial [Candidatus Heimdallarchaeota archaeon]